MFLSFLLPVVNLMKNNKKMMKNDKKMKKTRKIAIFLFWKIFAPLEAKMMKNEKNEKMKKNEKKMKK